MKPEILQYLNKLGSEYKPWRHATVVAFISQRFDVAIDEAETAVREWLRLRSQGG